jgi:hypothetical protein
MRVKNDNESLSYSKDRKYRDHLSKYQLLQKRPSQRNYLISCVECFSVDVCTILTTVKSLRGNASRVACS